MCRCVLHQLTALTHLAPWRHLAFRWCDLHHQCGRGWPSEWPHPFLCTLSWGPNLKTKKKLLARKDLHNNQLIFNVFMLNFLTDAGIIPNMIKTPPKHENRQQTRSLCQSWKWSNWKFSFLAASGCGEAPRSTGHIYVVFYIFRASVWPLTVVRLMT